MGLGGAPADAHNKGLGGREEKGGGRREKEGGRERREEGGREGGGRRREEGEGSITFVFHGFPTKTFKNIMFSCVSGSFKMQDFPI